LLLRLITSLSLDQPQRTFPQGPDLCRQSSWLPWLLHRQVGIRIKDPITGHVLLILKRFLNYRQADGSL
jgi:hypothetical protein